MPTGHYERKKRGAYKRYCSNGHDTTKWGRTPSRACRACLRDKRLKRLYGISLEEYVALWKRQDGKCAICGIPLDANTVGKPGWHEGVRIEVDHEHNKNKPIRQTVRGLLCGGRWKGCNRRIGHMDDLAFLEKVVIYIKNPPAQQVLKPDGLE